VVISNSGRIELELLVILIWWWHKRGVYEKKKMVCPLYT